jgi:chaperonin GroEL (HSP60 family)
LQAAEQEYEKEKLNERIAKLAGGVAVIQVMSSTQIAICYLFNTLFINSML